MTSLIGRHVRSRAIRSSSSAAAPSSGSTRRTSPRLEAGVLFDQTTGTLLCGDLFARPGRYAPTTADDIVTPASEAKTASRRCHSTRRGRQPGSVAFIAL
ncbi:MAG: hypothetical protein KY454_12310 [Actinobacteria bacterium]|nr:hypothetical protein [Actinomycetota bacterium]